MRIIPTILSLSLALGGVTIANAETLKIGVLAPLSGSGADWGQAMKGAAENAAEDANANGGLNVGGTNYQIEVIAYDSEYKANTAITAMNRLVFEDQVKFVVGPLGSAPLVAALPVINENKIITLTAAFTPKALGPDNKYSFRAVLPTDYFSGPQVNWVAGKLGAKRIGGLFPNDESGQQIAIAVVDGYEKAGAEFVSKEFFERGRVDFVPLLTRVLAQNIDAFELDGNSPQTAGLIVKQLRELGYKGAIIRTGGDGTAAILAVAGNEAAEGLYLHQLADPASPEIAAYTKRFEDKYKLTMNGFSPYFYAATQLVFASMEEAGTTTDTDKIAAAMEAQKDFPSIVGNVNWTGQDIWGSNHQINVPYYVAQIKNGVPTVVANCDQDKCE